MSESGGGGHGGGWLVTYCDMVTLLMACFIMVITFGNKEPDKFSRQQGSLAGAKGGNGSAGADKKAIEKAAVVMRIRSPSSRVAEDGSEMPSLYADPSPDLAAEFLSGLETPVVGTLADDYVMRVPLGFLFDNAGRLTPAGTHLLHAVAQNLRRLPYDLRFLMDDAAAVPLGVAICQQLAQNEGFHPGRLSVGVHPAPEPWNPSVRVEYVHRP
jgi:hypothetical protein